MTEHVPDPASDQNSASSHGSASGLPKHVAIIMDGNNRWSRLRNEPGISGHRAGAVAARRAVNLCADRGIQYLSLFVFSSENWYRPRKEVNGLMALFLNVLQRQEVNKLHDRNIRLKFIGSRQRFSPKLIRLMDDAEALTRNNTGMTVVVAADYGGRWDITQATRRIAEAVEKGQLTAAQVDENLIQRHISIGDGPSPDLCIRTGGEQRISNFLLWHFAYTELYFSSVFWPDFDAEHLDMALRDFAQRQRRFGTTTSSLADEEEANKLYQEYRPC
jgi:undecaprenyl diphosphate synthase